MDENIRFAARPGTRSGVSLVLWLLLGVLSALVVGTLFDGCTDKAKQTAVAVSSAVPTPSVEVGTNIRARVAALTKSEVAKHPALATWGNELAKVCFRFADTDLPDPPTLRGYFTLANYFLPESARPTVTDYAERLLTLYSADYPAAVAVQGAGAPYLTLVGQGIQDGLK